MRNRFQSGGRLALLALAATAACAGPAGAQTFTPIKPPAVPLVTRAPYMNTWLRNGSDLAPGTWEQYWNGGVKAITGIAMIDNVAYLFLGAPNGVPNRMTQTALQTTSTQSIFSFNAGGVDLSVDFLSPVEAKDLKRLSIPLTDISASAKSSDGAMHTVSVYFDISGEWAHGDSGQQIRWAPETIALAADGSGSPGTLSTWTVTPAAPTVLQQVNDYPSWGTVLWSTKAGGALTMQSGADTAVRARFVANGSLDGSNDANQPRAINDSWPVFAFSHAFGSVGTTATEPFKLLLGHVRDPAVSYLGGGKSSLWKQYWPAYENMLAFAWNDSADAFRRADKQDAKLETQAKQAGGAHYAAVAALALRQAFAGTELVGSASDPWLYLEEISSDDNVQTVDVMYPAMPAFLYMNPELVRYLVAPVMAYAESGRWPQAFAPHDLGALYPNGDGHDDGGGENMPVEETANMLIMVDAYLRNTTPANAAAYAKAHYPILHQWAEYLMAVPAGVSYPNALDPQFQNQTDDFTGPIAHSVNLALKGIIAVGAMGQIAGFAGNAADAAHYDAQARSMIATWAGLAQNSDATHLLMQYREPANAYSPDTTTEPDGWWSLKYNAFPDALLGLHLIPPSVLAEEARFYAAQETATGIPLDPRHSYTKADWELWTAAGMTKKSLKTAIYDEVFNWANTTTSATPFPDLYDTASAWTAFSARPVMGGAFAPLALAHAAAQEAAPAR